MKRSSTWFTNASVPRSRHKHSSCGMRLSVRGLARPTSPPYSRSSPRRLLHSESALHDPDTLAAAKLFRKAVQNSGARICPHRTSSGSAYPLFADLNFPVANQHVPSYTHVAYQQELSMDQPRSNVPPGTLDLMVLKTLDTLGPLHGYGIARRIEQVAQGILALNQGTLYPALLRLEQRGWIRSEWGASDNNRRAKYYSLTRTGRKQLAAETAEWERIAAMMGRILGNEGLS